MRNGTVEVSGWRDGWAAIGQGYKSPLIRCSAEVGSAEYLQILRDSEAVEHSDSLYGVRKWCCQQDGVMQWCFQQGGCTAAPAHMAEATMASLWEGEAPADPF